MGRLVKTGAQLAVLISVRELRELRVNPRPRGDARTSPSHSNANVGEGAGFPPGVGVPASAGLVASERAPAWRKPGLPQGWSTASEAVARRAPDGLVGTERAQEWLKPRVPA